MKIALFPGSFDPITIAHVDIVERALPLFDKMVIGIGLNSSKPNFLNPENREHILQAVYSNNPKIEISVSITVQERNVCFREI